MELNGIDDLLAETNPRIIERQVIDFIIKKKQKGKGFSTLHNYMQVSYLFTN